MQIYFAYGSNMDRALMRANCPSARALGTAVLENHRFIIAACGYASIERRAGSDVHGVLWRVTPRDVEALDRYESVATGLYDRQQVTVRTRGGRVRTLVYVAPARGTGWPRPGHLERVLAAAQGWDLPEDHLRDLAAWSSASPEVGA
jgi:gamma-glutamylcyclotransferase (GGCT)/AIG2-like uncharacterized protein YtfP